MKKLFAAVLFAAVLGVSLFAQDNQGGQNKKFKSEAEVYPLTIPIERIYSYRKGYVVQYRKGINQVGRVYIPMDWFEGIAGKADLVTIPRGKSWPYMTLYYRDGAFDHVRLYVVRERSHESWGLVPLTSNIDDRFEGVEDLKL
ncbi:MAG: hypothetical protein LBL43_04320 [Treponema sp.]|jgi:hypothetical protein|nr:hypothetical protein [Treponema sp.]